MAPFHLVYTDSKTWRLQVESQVNNSRLNCDKPSLVLGSQGIRLISSRQPYLTMASYSGGKFKQDMPPPGGYADIEYKRIPAQRIIGCKYFIYYFFCICWSAYFIFISSDKSAFIASSILTVYGYYYYSKRRVYLNRLKTDFRDHMIALEPLALAEQDRSYELSIQSTISTCLPCSCLFIAFYVSFATTAMWNVI